MDNRLSRVTDELDVFQVQGREVPGEHGEAGRSSNTSPLDADISFCFQVDSKAETFLLEPPTMQLKPGQQEVSNCHLAYTNTAKDSLLYYSLLHCRD